MPIGKAKKSEMRPLLLLSVSDRDKEQDARYFERMVKLQGETPAEAAKLLKSLQEARAKRRELAKLA